MDFQRLFAQTQRAQLQQQQQRARAQKPLVEFKAGKMLYKDGIVTANPRKGLIKLELTADGLLHFTWREREASEASARNEDDFILFPEEAKFERVEQCKDGRVYLLSWIGSDRKFFYWMQEPKEDKDAEFCANINQFINKPPSPNDAGEAGTGGGEVDENMLAMLGMQGGGQAGGRELHVSALQDILNSLNVPAPTGAPAKAPAPAAKAPAATSTPAPTPAPAKAKAAAGAATGARSTLTLNDILASEHVVGLVASDAQVRNALTVHLPPPDAARAAESPDAAADVLAATITGAPLRQSIERFEEVAATGELDGVLGLQGAYAYRHAEGTPALLEALQRLEQSGTREPALPPPSIESSGAAPMDVTPAPDDKPADPPAHP